MRLNPSTPHAINNADLALLHGFADLRSLKIDGRFAITNATAEHLAEHRELKSLTLNSAQTRNPGLDDTGMQKLAALKRLRKFKAFGLTRITDDSLTHLGSIRALQLGAAPSITGAGLRHLPKLKFLQLDACDGLSDSGLKSIRELNHSLKHVALTFCKSITAKSVGSLNTLMTVRVLNMHGSTACRPDLAHFAHMTGAGYSLQELTLHSAIQSSVGPSSDEMMPLRRLNIRYAPGNPSPYRVNIGHGAAPGTQDPAIFLAG